MPEHVHLTRHDPPLLNFPPTLLPQAGILKAGAVGIEFLPQGEARAGAGDDGCFCRTNFHLPRVALKEALVNAGFAQMARGPETLSAISSTGLAIENAVQLSV